MEQNGTYSFLYREDDESVKKESMFRITMKRLLKNKMAVLGGIILIFIVLASLLAPWISPYDYTYQELYNVNAGPSAEHWLGTDSLGRDILSRLLHGGRNSLTIGIVSTVLSALAGTALGATAGYYGGAYDNVIMRILDVFQAVPSMLLAIAISATLGTGYINCIIALTISGIPGSARMARASCMGVRNQDYIEAAVSINASEPRIIFKHVLMNALAPIFVMATMGVASNILMSASLSFVGLGVQPPEAEWGAMVSAGRNVLRYYPHICISPAIIIMLTVLSINMLGDGLRDALDPRLKQ